MLAASVASASEQPQAETSSSDAESAIEPNGAPAVEPEPEAQIQSAADPNDPEPVVEAKGNMWTMLLIGGGVLAVLVVLALRTKQTP